LKFTFNNFELMAQKTIVVDSDPENNRGSIKGTSKKEAPRDTSCVDRYLYLATVFSSMS
jgi:hypothetical protein